MDHLLNCHGEWALVFQSLPLVGAFALAVRGRLTLFLAPLRRSPTPAHDCQGHK